jgi:hypothetical protein
VDINENAPVSTLPAVSEEASASGLHPSRLAGMQTGYLQLMGLVSGQVVDLLCKGKYAEMMRERPI